MRTSIAFTVLSILLGFLFAAQKPNRVAAATSPGSATAASPHGAPQNRWRYQYSGGRWWYWTPDNRWSYFDGSRWRLLGAPASYVRRPVDPALLRLEYREGVLGRHRWPRRQASGGTANSGGAAGLPLSGTQGALGGAPSGSFTDPAGVPSAMNTSTGTSTGVGGLSAGGRPVTGMPLNGGGAVGGTAR